MNNNKIKIAAFLIAASTFAMSLSACDNIVNEPSISQTDTVDITSEENTSDGDTVTDTETETETNAETDATTEEITYPDGMDGYELDVKWHLGCVGSDKHKEYKNTIGYNTERYAYTDVINLGPAGTTVTFTDDKGESAALFATKSVYVVSSWKLDENGYLVLDKSGTNLNGDKVSSVNEGNKRTYTYTSTKDNETIRLCYMSGEKAGDSVVRPTVTVVSSAAPSIVTGKLTSEEELAMYIEGERERAFYSELKGKTFSVIGDSYLAGNGLDKNLVWTSLLAAKYGMEYNNYGVNGSTISNYVTTNNPMVDRYTSIKNNNPDIIIIEGGRNDYNKSVPIGEDGSLDTTTMKGASRYLITKLREKYPDALIVCFTVWEVGGKANSEGNMCSDYGRALIDVCKDMNVPYINAMDQELTGVYMTDPEFREQYCMKPTDISHLNADGMKLVLPKFEELIANFYKEYINK